MKKLKTFGKYFEARMEEYTVDVKGIEFVVKGYYEKGDERVDYYPDGSGYPGSPSSFDIREILTPNEDDVLEPVDNDMLSELGLTVAELEEKVLEQIED